MNEKLELVELFGEPALYTGARVRGTEVPEGVYKCDVRGDDETTGWFAGLSPFVLVNHFGAIFTKNPIQYGVDGHFWFEEETEPNFLGEDVSIKQYLQDDFEFFGTRGFKNIYKDFIN